MAIDGGLGLVESRRDRVLGAEEDEESFDAHIIQCNIECCQLPC